MLSLRRIDNDRAGDLSFWTDALRNRLRTVRGYALLDEREVQAETGQPGRRMRFGRDEGSQPYLYWITVFVDPAGLFAPSRIYVLEAGGRKDAFSEVEDELERAMASLRLL